MTAGKDKPLVFTRKIQLLLQTATKEEWAEAYGRLQEWKQIVVRAANQIVSHHYVQENLKEMLYLSEGTRVRLADIHFRPGCVGQPAAFRTGGEWGTADARQLPGGWKEQALFAGHLSPAWRRGSAFAGTPGGSPAGGGGRPRMSFPRLVAQPWGEGIRHSLSVRESDPARTRKVNVPGTHATSVQN